MRESCDAYIRDATERLSSSLRAVSSQEAAEAVLVTGKNLRSNLLIWASLLAGDQSRCPDEGVAARAAAVELLHTASLLHDDIIDQAETRRGRSSLRYSGGDDVAQAAGSTLVLDGCRLLEADTAATRAAFAQTLGVMCIGELRELEYSYDLTVTPDTAFEVNAKKTAALFILVSTLGCRTTDRIEANAIAHFLRNFGYAFQLADDVADLVSTGEESMKDVQADLAAGHYTLPVVFALKSGSPVRGDLAGLLGGPNVQPSDATRAIGRILASTAIDDCFELVDAFVDQSVSALVSVFAVSAARDEMCRLAIEIGKTLRGQRA